MPKYIVSIGGKEIVIEREAYNIVSGEYSIDSTAYGTPTIVVRRVYDRDEADYAMHCNGIESESQRKAVFDALKTLCDNPNFLKIQAIKLIRAMTGWGLRESKEFIDTNYC